MAKPPVSAHGTAADNLQTWILRVYIHCEGCRKKVYKVLQSLDGVYKTVIDSNQHKAIVTGSVNGETLVQKLLKSGKHAEILPESFAATAAGDNASGKSKKKKKQSNKQNDEVTVADDAGLVNGEKDASKSATDTGDGNDQEEVIPPVAVEDANNNDNDDGAVAVGGGGGSGGKKKKKNKKKAAPADGDTGGGVPPAEKVTESIEQLNLGRPTQQMAYAAPYDLPPHHNYYPTPAYGVSYSTSYPSAESSYYTPPVYGYAQSHPSVFYPVPPPPPSYRRSAFDDYDVEGGQGRGCVIRLCVVVHLLSPPRQQKVPPVSATSLPLLSHHLSQKHP